MVVPQGSRLVPSQHALGSPHDRLWAQGGWEAAAAWGPIRPAVGVSDAKIRDGLSGRLNQDVVDVMQDCGTLFKGRENRRQYKAGGCSTKSLSQY